MGHNLLKNGMDTEVTTHLRTINPNFLGHPSRHHMCPVGIEDIPKDER